MTPSKLRTAIYARVSTLDQDPAVQLRELRAYAAHRRLPITAEFIDQVSGTTADRPALDLSLTVPRYVNQRAFHINILQEWIHVSRLPFFTH
jgi:predicted site-specific integrase-resolvase